ncbi:hypothetical protein BB559_005829 [Furculomyces boomerangus]|uniref:Ribosomal RNA-processing protein 36 n=1 Tax=Furculomyces boomerangus TaxID=61424 RepID=A0A2T9Y6J1_9FUNG|nr:hypothetical protein BB559_005829 [Furculomyces boomerangus]
MNKEEYYSEEQYSDSDLQESDEETNDQSSGDEDRDERMETLRKELINLPFDKLLEIKNKIGAKEFERIYHQNSKKKKATKDLDSSSDSNKTFREKKNINVSKTNNISKTKKKKKKEPTVVSSKHPVSRFRQVVNTGIKPSLDPRFERSSGNFNKDLFAKSYQFLEDYNKNEVQEIKKKLEKIKDKSSEEAEDLKLLLQQIESRKLTASTKSTIDDIKKRHVKREMDLVKQGKKPYYLKKSVIKQIDLSEKFEKIKDTKKLDALLEKKRKRNAAKDHKQIPFKRRNSRLKGHKDVVLNFDSCGIDSNLGPNCAISSSEDQTCRIWDVRLEKSVGGIGVFDSRKIPLLFNKNDFVLEYEFEDEINEICTNNKIDSFPKTIVTALDSGRVAKFSLDSLDIQYINEQQHQGDQAMQASPIIIFNVFTNVYKCLLVASGGFDCNITISSETSNCQTFTTENNNQGQMLNPPFVHCLQSYNNLYDDDTDNSFVAGLGDGSIMAFYPIDNPENQIGFSEKSDKHQRNEKVWKSVRWIGAHKYIVSDIEYCSFDQGTIASSGLDGYIKLWDVAELIYTGYDFENYNETQKDESTNITQVGKPIDENCENIEINDMDGLVYDEDLPLTKEFDVSNIVGRPDWIVSLQDKKSMLYTYGANSENNTIYGILIE